VGRIVLSCCKILKSTTSNLWKRASRFGARNLAVVVHREIEVCGECTTKRARCGDCAALVTSGAERHDWDHVNGSDSRVDAAAGAALRTRRQVDRRHCKPRQCSRGKDEGVCFANVGVHTPVMISVVMNVEQLHPWRTGNH
jgi:hypothetical protein